MTRERPSHLMQLTRVQAGCLPMAPWLRLLCFELDGKATSPPTADSLRRSIGVRIQQLHEFDLEQRALECLQARLNRLCHEQASTATHSYGIFVHHPEPYTCWSNSNHMTADWLKELGCEGRGRAFGSSWRVRPLP